VSGLQIYDPRERALVRLADVAFAPLAWLRRRRAPGPVRRVLLLRLERIGDLLMVLDAISDARAAWPEAEIDLAVGSWNVPLAKLIPGIDTILTMDVPWLARETRGERWRALVGRAREWRRRRYDLVINFEPDVRSNLLAWHSGAPRRFGYWTGGGGALLSDAAAYEPREHVAVNARRLVARAAGRPAPDSGPAATPSGARLVPPPAAVGEASAILDGAERPLVGIHASGGRESKQWHLDRFAAVGRRLAESHGATIVLTGSAADRALVDEVRLGLAGLAGTRVIDASGRADLTTLAAVLARLDVLITGDTGPMHLAAAMGTPIVALFGPSAPWRYGPLAAEQRVLRVSLPCSPCGQVRLPPERCRGHVPDCMDGIQVDAVWAAAAELLAHAKAVPA
jgi:heptosyltransferase-1